jgi:uncharacterized protein with HEPN domain
MKPVSKYHLTISVLIIGVLALCIHAQPKIVGYVFMGIVVLGITVIILMPSIRNAISRDYVLLNRKIIQERLKEIERQIVRVGVKEKTRGEFQSLKSEFALIMQFPATDKYVCWPVIREKLAEIVNSLNYVAKTAEYEAVIAERARGQTLGSSVPVGGKSV